MAGVVVEYEKIVTSHRILRDDVLDAMYGKYAGNPKNLIDAALQMARSIVLNLGVNSLDHPVLGLFPGDIRSIEANSRNEAIRMAAMMFSSLANLDFIDEVDADDAPNQEENNRRLSTEVREIVVSRNPNFLRYFNRSASIVEGGENVRIGFLSPRTAIHYSVLHPARQASSVRDARSRFFELSCIFAYTGVKDASLILAVPREDDPTLGNKQRNMVARNIASLTLEAKSASVNVRPIYSAEAAAAETEALA